MTHVSSPSTRTYIRTSPLQDIFIERVIEATPERHALFSRSISLGLLILVLLASLVLGSFEHTISYFSDIENSTGNTFAAGPLDFTLDPSGLQEATIGAGEDAGFIITPTVTPVPNNLPFLYSVKALVGGNPTLCNALEAQGFAPPLDYSGPASGFVTTATEDLTPWELLFFVPLATVIPEGAQCEVELVYSAYQHNGAEGTEYHDEERVHILLTFTNIAPVAPLRLFQVPEVLGESTPIEDETASTTPDTAPEEETPPPPGEETSLPPELPVEETPPAPIEEEPALEEEPVFEESQEEPTNDSGSTPEPAPEAS